MKANLKRTVRQFGWKVTSVCTVDGSLLRCSYIVRIAASSASAFGRAGCVILKVPKG